MISKNKFSLVLGIRYFGVLMLYLLLAAGFARAAGGSGQGVDSNGRPTNDASKMPTPEEALALYTTDLVKQAEAHQAQNFIYREDTAERVFDAAKNSQEVLWTFHPQDGMTSVLESAALLAHAEGYEVRLVKVKALTAGSTHRGMIDGRLIPLINAVKGKKIILVFDRVENLKTGGDENPFENIARVDADVKIILTATVEGHRLKLKDNLTNWQPEKLETLERQQLNRVLKGMQIDAFEKYGITVEIDALERLLDLAESFRVPEGRMGFLRTEFDSIINHVLAIRNQQESKVVRVAERELKYLIERDLKAIDTEIKGKALMGISVYQGLMEQREEIVKKISEQGSLITRLKQGGTKNADSIFADYIRVQTFQVQLDQYNAEIEMKTADANYLQRQAEELERSADKKIRESAKDKRKTLGILRDEISKMQNIATTRGSEYRQQLAEYEKLLKNEAALKDLASKSLVTVGTVNAVMSERLHAKLIPFSDFEIEQLFRLEEVLGETFVGQEAARDVVARAYRRAVAGLNFGNRPQGIFLFMGPTGTGKTELVKALERATGRKVIYLNMEKFSESHSVSSFTGPPPGYVGGEIKTVLEDILLDPEALILFDEIEKAHESVWRLLLGVMDEGKLTLKDGRTLLFKRSQMIFTSNVGANIYAMKPDSPERLKLELQVFEASERPMMENLRNIDRAAFDLMLAGELLRKRGMPPEFVGRIEEIVSFQQHSRSNMYKIVAQQVENFRRDLYREKKLILELDTEVIRQIVLRTYDPKLGGRSIRRGLNKYIKDVMVEPMLREFKMNPPRDSVIVLRWDKRLEMAEYVIVSQEQAAQLIAEKKIYKPSDKSFSWYKVMTSGPLIDEPKAPTEWQLDLPFLAEEMMLVDPAQAKTEEARNFEIDKMIRAAEKVARER